MQFDRIECEYTEWRNAIFAEVFVLVVAEDQQEVRVERIERSADGAEPLHRALAMCRCSLTGLMRGPFLLHRRWPVGGIGGGWRQARVLQQALEDPRHAGIVADQQRRVGCSQSEKSPPSVPPWFGSAIVQPITGGWAG